MKKDELNEVKEQYRYVCPACTNIAFITTIVASGEGRVCKSCGKIFTTKKENYIKI